MTSKIIEIIQNFSLDTQKLLKDNLIAEYLFGSIARSENNHYSDIDILIIVKHFDFELRQKLSSLSSDYSLNHNLCFSPILKDLDSWEKNKKHHTLFYQEVQRDGIRLC